MKDGKDSGKSWNVHCVKPGERVFLGDWPTDAKAFHDDRKSAEQEFEELREELSRLQNLFYADRRFKLLVVLQAMDAGGKDGTIRRVLEGVNPQGVVVTPFKVPSSEELDHDFLWRIHRAVPGRGMIGIFNRSHYEDVLVVRVEELVPESVWSQRYDQINQFERLLADTGTTILKFYLHISKSEQKERFLARLEKPHKRWKFSVDDVKKRNKWHDYRAAYEEVLSRCSTTTAPWHIIPADDKWYRNLAISMVLVNTLRQMDLRFPEAEEIPEGLIID